VVEAGVDHAVPQRPLDISSANDDPAGLKLWQGLPDPIDLILKISFDGVEEAELATVVQVLQAATGRLTHH
jgi:hypothetical protein